VKVDELLIPPETIPRLVPEIVEEAALVETFNVGIPGALPPGFSSGARTGVFGGIDVNHGALPPPPAPSAAKSSRPRLVRAGGQVDPAVPIFQPKPEYPHLARSVRAEGTVRLEAVISTDGTVRDLKVVSGHPLLVKAALDAVARWRYQPTLLNGEPVEVLTEIEVHFRLAG
jgi:protein TonB